MAIHERPHLPGCPDLAQCRVSLLHLGPILSIAPLPSTSHKNHCVPLTPGLPRPSLDRLPHLPGRETPADPRKCVVYASATAGDYAPALPRTCGCRHRAPPLPTHTGTSCHGGADSPVDRTALQLPDSISIARTRLPAVPLLTGLQDPPYKGFTVQHLVRPGFPVQRPTPSSAIRPLPRPVRPDRGSRFSSSSYSSSSSSSSKSTLA